jgi:hypothetical protein
MKTRKNSGIVGALALATALGMSGFTGAGAATTSPPSTSHTLNAHVVKRTLLCYRGTAVRRVVAVHPKCPAGWSTRKPVLFHNVAFSATYKGTIAMLWSSSEVKVTSLTGTGTGTHLGLSAVSGTGSAAPSSQCDPINGVGTLSGGGSTLKLLIKSTTACGAAGAAPTTVTISNGSALVTGGTGKFAGATGTLKVTGSFAIQSTTAGSNESDAFTATLSGTLKVK